MEQTRSDNSINYSKLPEELMETELRLYWEDMKICNRETSVLHPDLKKIMVFYSVYFN